MIIFIIIITRLISKRQILYKAKIVTHLITKSILIYILYNVSTIYIYKYFKIIYICILYITYKL